MRSAKRRQRLRMAPTVAPILGASVALFVFAADARLMWPQLIGCVLLAMLAVSLAGVVMPIRLSIDVDSPERARHGLPFETTIRVRNLSRFACPKLVVRQRWTGRRRLVDELNVLIERVAAGECVVARSTRLPLARGTANTLSTDLEASGVFGFFFRTLQYRVTQPLVVLPAPLSSSEMQLVEGHRSGGTTLPGQDSDIHGVRDWRTGDRISRVHWRSVARTGRMTVWEQDGRSAGWLCIVVLAAPRHDGRSLADAVFERAISAVASVGSVALRAGTSLCLIAQATDGHHVVRHPAHDAALLDELARVEAGDRPCKELLEHALTHLLTGGVLLTVSSSTTPMQWRAAVMLAAARVGVKTIDAVDLISADELASA